MSLSKQGYWPSEHCELNHNALHKLTEKLLPLFKSVLCQEKIPPDPSLIKALTLLYIPLSSWLASKQGNAPLVIGINGSQGAGKSTLTKILSIILQQGFNKTVLSFSIDDLYKSKKQRDKLAKDIHPLLSTRGVPGTHNVDLGISIFRHLLNKNQKECLIPVFDKSTDECFAESHWQRFSGACDIILFEGWCVGSIAQNEAELKTPVNKLEKLDDRNGTWRKFVNQQLKGPYAELFSFIDILIMLKVPDFKKVYEWRKLQEQKLRDGITDNQKPGSTMNDAQIERFIMHFERITRHTLNEMPDRCDIVLQLAENHQIKNVITQLSP